MSQLGRFLSSDKSPGNYLSKVQGADATSSHFENPPDHHHGSNIPQSESPLSSHCRLHLYQRGSLYLAGCGDVALHPVREVDAVQGEVLSRDRLFIN